MRSCFVFASLVCACAALFVSPVHAADWPTWRFDARRGAISPQELPAELHLQWVRELPPPRPAWPDQPKMPFDIVDEPIVAGQTLFVGSSRTDTVTALDTRTGAEKWRFFAEGPVRFAPLHWEGRLYFVSDDGHLYCLDASSGKLLWKFRGGPADRRVLGNERLVSAWPARGAPVIADGTVYFAASIWPFMGIFIHALDARTGAVVWTNDGDGSIYMKQPHNSESFASIAPQGAMAIAGDCLLIPGGRSVPACYDRKTGKMLRYQLAENSRRGGGSDVCTLDKMFFNGGAAFELETEKYLGDFSKQVVLTDDVLYGYSAGAVRAFDAHSSNLIVEESIDRKGATVKSTKWKIAELGKCTHPPVETMIRAGSRLYLGTLNDVTAVGLADDGSPSAVVWRAALDGIPGSLVAADDRLFVSTHEGRLYCFGSRATTALTHRLPATTPQPGPWSEHARAILETTKVRDGHCIAWGAGSGGLVADLARQSNLRIIVVEPSADKASRARELFLAAGLYGERVVVLEGYPLALDLPPYLASLMVAEDSAACGFKIAGPALKKMFASLRPYGGVAWLPLAKAERQQAAWCITETGLAGARVVERDNALLLYRDGALPGTANWTHEHADAANTRVSRDQVVKAPLGLLWFGGPSNEGILPRHGHGPQPQVIDGRLIIEGVDMLRAMDIYTGRILWETRLPGVGDFYNMTLHQPGANASGTNYISTADGIYVAYGTSCLRLDPATGHKLGDFQLPPVNGTQEPPRWGYLNVCADYLIGGADPLYDPSLRLKAPAKAGSDDDKKPGDTVASALTQLKGFDNDNLSASRHLVVLDRHSGKVLWSAHAKSGFRHNAISAGGGRLYAIDRLSGSEENRLKRRGETPNVKPRLTVFDLRSGQELWSSEANIFGTWLSYSADRDILLESGRVARDTLFDEPKGMRAYRGLNGSMLWFQPTFVGPAMIHGDVVLKDRSACDLLTGLPKMRQDPITGLPAEWSWVRNYGCNTPAASEHLLTFRSGAAGYFDLCNDGGTGNLGGFRSSCTNNLIVAGGLLNVPDYTRTCTCSYQNQSSLALVHWPDAEMWTSFGPAELKGPVRRVGINFGAPGDRKAPDGTLWLEYPSVGGPSPVVPVSMTPAKPELFRRHASRVSGDMNWVAASGVKGVSGVTVTLGKEDDKERIYTLRLYFSEPDALKPGQRLFNVTLQGQEVLREFDIVQEAGGVNRALVKEIRGVKVTKDLTLRFAPSAKAVVKSPILCGLEVLAEGW